ncbi:hypothetical protein [Aeromonas veronii]|uniref:hypothetical protein n=1 Tax=Aeromonas veronii TaxID=654 RepID=UPI002B482344|nr:hypothetical protein [Aeromonas veronii]
MFDLYPCIAWHCHKMAPCEIAYRAEVAVGGGLLRFLAPAPLAPVKIGLSILAVNLFGGQLRII